MGVSAKQALTGIRVYMGNPTKEKINNGSVLLVMYDKLDHYTTLLQSTGESWLVDRVTLTVPADTSELSISATNFGIPFLVETVDSSDTSHISTEIPIVRQQDIDRYSVSNTRSAGLGQHAAEVVAFFRISGWKALFLPTSSVQSEYRVWHQPLRSAPAPLANDVQFLDNFINLIRVDTALTCLPYCDWPESRHRRIEAQLTRTLSDLLRSFEMFKFQAFQSDTDDKPGYWGIEREFEDLF